MEDAGEMRCGFYMKDFLPEGDMIRFVGVFFFCFLFFGFYGFFCLFLKVSLSPGWDNTGSMARLLCPL